MAGELLIDSDVLIDYLRGRAEAVAYLEGLTENLLISAMTLAELYAGVREGAVRAPLKWFRLTRQTLSKAACIAEITEKVMG